MKNYLERCNKISVINFQNTFVCSKIYTKSTNKKEARKKFWRNVVAQKSSDEGIFDSNDEAKKSKN